MSAKQGFGDFKDALRKFYATAIRHEISDATVRGYLRAASQIMDVWQQIDDAIAVAIAQGLAPAAAYERYGYALAFIHIAKAYQVCAQALLEADVAWDPSTSGFLPPVTYAQAEAFCRHIQPHLELAITALHAPDTSRSRLLPVPFGPRIAVDHACPITHLQGMLAAARETQAWAEGRVAQYEQAAQHAATPVADSCQRHLTLLHDRLELAQSRLRYGVDLVGQVSAGESTPALRQQAEKRLWKATDEFFTLLQVIALPELIATPEAPPRQHHRQVYQAKRITADELWHIAAPSAQRELRGTTFGEQAMREVVDVLGEMLSARAQQYLDDVAHALAHKSITQVAASAQAPFAPIYHTRRSVTIAGGTIPRNYELYWNYSQGRIEVAKHFGCMTDWRSDPE